MQGFTGKGAPISHGTRRGPEGTRGGRPPWAFPPGSGTGRRAPRALCGRKRLVFQEHAAWRSEAPLGVSVLRGLPGPRGCISSCSEPGTACPPWAPAWRHGPGLGRQGQRETAGRGRAQGRARARPVDESTNVRGPPVPQSEAAERSAQSPAPRLAPSAPDLAASGRAGHEGRAAASQASWGPASSASPRPPPALRAALPHREAIPERSCTAPGRAGERGFPRALLAAAGARRGQASRLRVSACRATAGRAAGFCQLFGVTGPG